MNGGKDETRTMNKKLKLGDLTQSVQSDHPPLLHATFCFFGLLMVILLLLVLLPFSPFLAYYQQKKKQFNETKLWTSGL